MLLTPGLTQSRSASLGCRLAQTCGLFLHWWRGDLHDSAPSPVPRSADCSAGGAGLRPAGATSGRPQGAITAFPFARRKAVRERVPQRGAGAVSSLGRFSCSRPRKEPTQIPPVFHQFSTLQSPACHAI